MADVGPSLAKLRREWCDGEAVEVPAGMIARRVLHGAMAKLGVGESLTIKRVSERRFRVER